MAGRTFRSLPADDAGWTKLKRAIHFTIPGAPQPWSRARYNGKTGRFYKSDTEQNYRAKVVGYFRAAKGFELIGPLAVELTFYMPRPKTVKNVWACTRPDIDNLQKIIADSLNGLAYKDDCQIVNSIAQKIYHEVGGEPRTVVRIWEIDNK